VSNDRPAAILDAVTDRAAVELRLATRVDEPAVRRCVADAYQVYVPLMSQVPAPMLEDYVTLIAAGVVHVAELAGQVRGVIVAWPEVDHLYVDNIAVDPDSQGTGIGSRLLELADDLARANQRNELRLYTNEVMTSNLAYYPNRGFIETHRATDKGYRRVYFRRLVLR
jgi:GNAT superfamily N-acetyltransferase